MNKYMRVIFATVVLVAMVLLASSRMAWASNSPTGNNGGLQAQGPLGMAQDDQDPGSVRPPPVVLPPIQAPGIYSVGGVCTFQVTSMADKVTLQADLLAFTSLGDKPQSIASYLAGVCRATYAKDGVGMADLAAADGTVVICFAAVPNVTGKIYVYDDTTWTALDTTLQSGLYCAPATKSAKYVLVTEP